MAEPPLDDITLYMRNDVIVDNTPVGTNVRRFDDVNTATSASQTVAATHTQDSVERTFSPALFGLTGVKDARSFQGSGWAVPLADFTPSDAACDALLVAQTVTVSVRVSANWTGTPVGTPVSGAVFRVSLWRFNPTTDSAVQIGAADSLGQDWTVLQAGETRTITPAITVASDVVFASGETLMLQVGLNTGTLGNPLTGTSTYTFTMLVDAALNNITFDTVGLRRLCRVSPAGAVAPSGVIQKTVKPIYEGAIAPSATLGRKVYATYEGSVSPNGSVTKKAQATYEGSVAPAGELTKEPQVAFEGTVAPAGDLGFKVRKLFAGSIAPSGTLDFLARMTFEGVIAPSGALLKKVRATYEGAIAPSGALDNAFIAVRSFAGSIAPSGAITRKVVQKVFSGVIAPSGIATSRLFKVFAGSITPVGTLRKRVSKFFEAELGPTGDVAPVIRKIRSIFVVD